MKLIYFGFEGCLILKDIQKRAWEIRAHKLRMVFAHYRALTLKDSKDITEIAKEECIISRILVLFHEEAKEPWRCDERVQNLKLYVYKERLDSIYGHSLDHKKHSLNLTSFTISSTDKRSVIDNLYGQLATGPGSLTICPVFCCRSIPFMTSQEFVIFWKMSKFSIPFCRDLSQTSEDHGSWDGLI
jgi:hypothetical protein